MESRVQCYRCKRYIRATDSHINLICKACQVDKKKLIEGFITKWNGVREMLVGAIKGSGIDLLKIVDYIDKEIEKWE